MKRYVSLVLILLMLPAFLAVPAMADDIADSSWIELLDYNFANGGSTNTLILKNGDSFTYPIPGYYVLYSVEILFTSHEALSSLQLQKSNGTLLNMSIVSYGEKLYKATLDFYDGLSYIKILPTFVNDNNSQFVIYSLRVSTFGSIYRSLPGSMDGVMFDGSSFSARYDGSSYVSTSWSGSNASLENRRFSSYLRVLGNVHSYDYVDVNLNLYVSEIASIAVDDGTDPLPFEINEIYQPTSSVGTVPLLIVTLRIDVGELESGRYPTIRITGSSSSGLNTYTISAITGLVLIEQPNVFTYWMNRLKLSIDSGFTAINTSITTWGQNLMDSINALPDKIAESLQGLFVPSDSVVQDMGQQSEELAQDRFGGAYEGALIIDEFASQLRPQEATQILTVPVVNLDILGVPFPLGGWEVDLVPDGAELIVETCKILIDIVATLAFVNGLRNRLERTLDK